jgi:hypothetical protein
MVLKDKTGKQCSAVEVFTLSIKTLIDRLMNVLETIEVREFLHYRVIWVLTVPSASTDSAKQLMRESAERVGFSNTYLNHNATKFQTH